MKRCKIIRLSPAQEAAAHWREVVVPELVEEARQIEAVITNVAADTPEGMLTLIKCWEQQFHSLLLYARGSEQPLRDQIFTALRDSRNRVIQLRERLRTERRSCL
jgi:hypothetical protein